MRKSFFILCAVLFISSLTPVNAGGGLTGQKKDNNSFSSFPFSVTNLFLDHTFTVAEPAKEVAVFNGIAIGQVIVRKDTGELLPVLVLPYREVNTGATVNVVEVKYKTKHSGHSLDAQFLVLVP